MTGRVCCFSPVPVSVTLIPLDFLTLLRLKTKKGNTETSPWALRTFDVVFFLFKLWHSLDRTINQLIEKKTTTKQQILWEASAAAVVIPTSKKQKQKKKKKNEEKHIKARLWDLCSRAGWELFFFYKPLVSVTTKLTSRLRLRRK